MSDRIVIIGESPKVIVKESPNIYPGREETTPTDTQILRGRLVELNFYESRQEIRNNTARTIGALGPIPFYVSGASVQTIQNAVWSGGGNHAAHKRIGSTTLVEATGSDADTFSFDMILSADLGVNPWEAITALLGAERQQIAMTLTIGDHAYGRYRWLIESHKIKLNRFDSDGNLYEAAVSINLIEYLSS